MSPVLAIDTSGSSSHIALRVGDQFFERTVVGALSHDEELAASVHDTLKGARCDPHTLSAIIVGIGPGSFTGLRIGLAFAQGLALSSGASLFVSSSLKAAAYSARGRSAALVAFSDARRGEVFLGGWFDSKGKASEFLSERIVSVSNLSTVVSQALESACIVGATPLYVGEPGLLEGVVLTGTVSAPKEIARSLLTIFAEGELVPFSGAVAVAGVTPRYLREVSAKSIAERQSVSTKLPS